MRQAGREGGYKSGGRGGGKSLREVSSRIGIVGVLPQEVRDGVSKIGGEAIQGRGEGGLARQGGIAADVWS